MSVVSYPISPVPKPRQTRSDRWKVRPCVVRYRAFADECKANDVWFASSEARIIFVIPMPKSWSKKKKFAHNGEPHRQRPDLSNLLKALEDACYHDDSIIWDISVQKVWGYAGEIRIINP